MKSITVEEFKTRIPAGNSDYFNELDKEEQESYIALTKLSDSSHFLGLPILSTAFTHIPVSCHS